MNKGLFIHILVSIFYTLMILFILNGESTNVKDRAAISTFFVLSNILTLCFIGAVSDLKWYKERI